MSEIPERPRDTADSSPSAQTRLAIGPARANVRSADAEGRRRNQEARMAKKQKQAKGASKGQKAAKQETRTAPREGVRDPRLPAAGTTLVRPYKGKDHRVTVLQ